MEQQVGRGCLPPVRVDPYDDTLIRARDGYWFVCEVRPGTTMPCARCNNTLPVPALRFKEVRCERCIAQGKDGRTLCGYFPLDETLIEHLRRTDPLRGAIERLAAEADEANHKLLVQKARETSNMVEAGVRDDYRRIAGIKMVGYTARGR